MSDTDTEILIEAIQTFIKIKNMAEKSQEESETFNLDSTEEDQAESDDFNELYDTFDNKMREYFGNKVKKISDELKKSIQNDATCEADMSDWA